jgi:probable F420-dependent oxidoreductase
VKLDVGGYAKTVRESVDTVTAAEAAGYDGAWVAETQIDALTALAVAAEHTSRIQLGTGIVVAFARNPMTVAMTANDVQFVSGGRLLLGVGSQIRPHITKRFSMPWSHPAARMREFILAVRAIWSSWANGTPLRFQGDFYTHTLMTPFFDPGPNPFGNPPIFLAGVGELMTEVAGEVADGFLCHGFSTERYVREVTLPALERGRARAGKTMAGFEISGPAFVATGNDEAEIVDAIAAVKQQISFYGSTPAYRRVLELHGWGALGDELNALSKRGSWDEMAGLIDDEILHTIAVVGTPEQVVPEIVRRYGDIAHRMTLTVPYHSDPDRWVALFDALRVTDRGL